MQTIRLQTFIKAKAELVFDLSRDIDLHKQSAVGTNETAVAGKTEGLLALGETVTWRANHFGLFHRLTVQITEMERPLRFTDVMLKGPFKSMQHQHLFSDVDDGTWMYDVFSFEAPFGYLGRFVELLFLSSYMTAFLKKRNEILKAVAESMALSSDDQNYPNK
ncbi:SRPBCC family protein [Sphingobacterium bambusae]|uniref:SRPBCC family protein n=1 Tax=Sphingobacterium bambusae TaxID=662858 RepID=A0ABW6B9V1_9SPHI|nr:SRPBCC family protein [Sphingobacterium bambusae]WPL48300.1 SRPBCC family protein [Sphingobacterium bambusae]